MFLTTEFDCGIILHVADADMAQTVERILGKDEVTGSNPVISSRKDGLNRPFLFYKNTAEFVIKLCGIIIALKD